MEISFFFAPYFRLARVTPVNLNFFFLFSTGETQRYFLWNFLRNSVSTKVVESSSTRRQTYANDLKIPYTTRSVAENQYGTIGRKVERRTRVCAFVGGADGPDEYVRFVKIRVKKKKNNGLRMASKIYCRVRDRKIAITTSTNQGRYSDWSVYSLDVRRGYDALGSHSIARFPGTCTDRSAFVAAKFWTTTFPVR